MRSRKISGLSMNLSYHSFHCLISMFCVLHCLQRANSGRNFRNEYKQYEADTRSCTAGVIVVDSDNVKKTKHVFRESAAGLHLRKDVVKQDRAIAHEIHEVIFAVKERNLDKLTQILHDVSDPASNNYGMHMTRKEIFDLTSNLESRDAIIEYVQDAGAIIISESLYSEFITAQAPISLWEEFFNAEFFTFHHEHKSSGIVSKIARAEEYSIPLELDGHVVSVFHTIQMPMTISGTPIISPVITANFTGNIISNAVSGYITPSVLNQYYNINSNTGNKFSTQAVFETNGQTLGISDLITFQRQFSIPSQTAPTMVDSVSIVNGCSVNRCVEANLDIQYLTAISQESPTTFWYTSQNFASWLLAVANTNNPPLVISISYGSEETTVSQSEFDAFDLQVQKLGAMGVTVIAASGDDGANSYHSRGNFAACGYTPLFPASCPHVTAVGATMGPESGTEEVTCQSDLGGVITGGGGFSTYYSQPDWQSSVVANYFNTVEGTVNAPVSGFNSVGRGYPDVALAGTSYMVYVNNIMVSVSGTSASCPVFAGMVSLVNAARLGGGKSSLGYLNPILYAQYTSFANDVVSGFNNCPAISTTCCAEGFYAATDWDPATGLGSIDFSKFMTALSTFSATPQKTLSPKPTHTPTSLPATIMPSLRPSLMSASPTTKPSQTPSSSAPSHTRTSTTTTTSQSPSSSVPSHTPTSTTTTPPQRPSSSVSSSDTNSNSLNPSTNAPSSKPMSTIAPPIQGGSAHSPPPPPLPKSARPPLPKSASFHKISSSNTAYSDHPPTFKPTTKCHKVHA